MDREWAAGQADRDYKRYEYLPGLDENGKVTEHKNSVIARIGQKEMREDLLELHRNSGRYESKKNLLSALP